MVRTRRRLGRLHESGNALNRSAAVSEQADASEKAPSPDLLTAGGDPQPVEMSIEIVASPSLFP
jgi:hypothetical protein